MNECRVYLHDPQMSHNEVARAIERALNGGNAGPDGRMEWKWPSEVWDDRVIWHDQGRCYQATYTMDAAGEVTLGEPVEVVSKTVYITAAEDGDAPSAADLTAMLKLFQSDNDCTDEDCDAIREWLTAKREPQTQTTEMADGTVVSVTIPGFLPLSFAKGNVATLIKTFGKWAGGDHDTCVAKLSGKVKDPAKLCAWLKDRFKGNPFWRGKSDAKGHGELIVDPEIVPVTVRWSSDITQAERELEQLSDALTDTIVASGRMYGPDSTTVLFNDLSAFAEAPEWIPYLPKPGTYKHPRWGDLKITKERAERFVTNFQNQVYQDRLPVDAEHQTKLSGAMAWITDMRLNDDGSADAKVEWTERGTKLIADNRFKYFSPEWFETWSDPATDTVHQDVAIGGALTTRPFFKQGALRPLVASEGCLYAPPSDDAPPADDQPIHVTFTALERADAAAAEREDSPVADEITRTLTEEEYQSFTEMQRQFAEEKAAREAAEAQAQQFAERVTSLERERRRDRLTDIVFGRGGEGDGARFFGEPEKHVAFMEKIADQFGEDSDEFRFYVENQRAHLAALKESGIFSEVGTPGHGAGGGSDAWGQIETKAKALVADGKATTFAEAVEQVAETDPALYRQYREERGL